MLFGSLNVSDAVAKNMLTSLSLTQGGKLKGIVFFLAKTFDFFYLNKRRYLSVLPPTHGLLRKREDVCFCCLSLKS
jgi:hypothetical protein